MRKRNLPGAVLSIALLSLAAPPRSISQTTVVVTPESQAETKKPNNPNDATPAAPDENRNVDINAFIAQLSKISDTLNDWLDDDDRSPTKEDLARLRSSLPHAWTIRTDDGAFVISSEPLRNALGAGKTGDASAWIDHVLREAQSYAHARTASPEGARHELQKILGSSEFAGVRPPNAWDLFRQRLSAWLGRILLKLFSGMTRYPIAGEILFWGILLLAVSLLARWLFLFLVRRDQMAALSDQEVVTATRTWQEWIRLARQAAARQDFREAVHAAYWAGIARLEDLSALPKDRTKTPREYLRALSTVSQDGLASRPTDYAAPLKQMTTLLERVWYANRGAVAKDYDDTLQQLKALGCQME